MGQSINVLLYGVKIPIGINLEELREKWEDHIQPKVEAFNAKLDLKKHTWNWGMAMDTYIPSCPSPDDSDPDNLIGFYICRGYHDHYSSHQFPAMTFAEMRSHKATARIIKRCRRRWSRFARWARTQGVEFGKPRIWRTRTEVA